MGKHCIILDVDDVRSKADGYHLDVWKGIMRTLRLPASTESVTLTVEVDEYEALDSEPVAGVWDTTRVVVRDVD
jgi:hypothetical protein